MSKRLVSPAREGRTSSSLSLVLDSRTRLPCPSRAFGTPQRSWPTRTSHRAGGASAPPLPTGLRRQRVGRGRIVRAGVCEQSSGQRMRWDRSAGRTRLAEDGVKQDEVAQDGMASGSPRV